MLLYDSPVSGNCYKVRLLFAHLGLPYERRALDVADRSNRPEVLGGLNPALRVPTLVLHGEEDPVFPLGHARALEREIPGARLVVLKQTGHLVQAPNWRVVVPAILEHTAAR